MRDEFSTKLIGTHSSIVLGRPCLCSSSPPATQWGLCITTQGADYQPRPLIHVPLAQLTHKSGLLRKYQFLSLVLLSSVVKPHQSSLRPLLTHGVPVSPSTPRPTLGLRSLGLRSKRSSQSFKVGLSPVFHLQNIPWNCLPFSNALQNKCLKKLSQSSLTQSYSVSLKYGFSKSLDFLPSAPFSLIPPPHPKTQQHTRPEGDTELSLAFPNLNIPATQSSAHPRLSHIYNIRDQGRGRLLLIHTTLGCSFCWCWGRGVCVCLCAV